MGDIETIGILDEIQSLVHDKLQVVSYKWLSRNFLVSSNAAKRLLQDFVDKYGTGFEVVYSLSGWLKNNPSTYHIILVSRSKIEEAKLEFDESCTIQVYSVQACIPKDPAAIWNAEFVQAEELSKQPIKVDNSLRDNRFCGVLNPSVRRNAGGECISSDTPSGASGLSKSATIAQPKQSNQPSPVCPPLKDVKRESLGHGNRAADSKHATEKEKLHQMHPNNKKGQSDRNSSGSSGALANMWDRASAKPKPDDASRETKNATPNAATAEAQISAREALDYGSSDDDTQQVSVRRKSNGEGSRKRRVVFDFSDEENDFEEAVNLASPDLPKKEAVLVSKQNTNIPEVERNKLSFEEEKESKARIKDAEESKTSPTLREEYPTDSNGKTTDTSSGKKHVPENNHNLKGKVTDGAPGSPKRRKVLKTRIDERGREVTEVVWEGEETDRKPDKEAMNKTESNAMKNAIDRPHEIKKSATANQAGKIGSRKAGCKDPKQGNLLSFFKKVP